MPRVLFARPRNICRSAMAECVFTHIIKRQGIENKFIVSSAGTSDEEDGNPIYPPARRKLQTEGIQIVNHRATQLRASDYDKYDLYLCAEERNEKSAIRIFGGDEQSKVKRMLDLSDNPRNIADPWWTGNFDETYDDVLEACDSVIKYAFDNGLI